MPRGYWLSQILLTARLSGKMEYYLRELNYNLLFHEELQDFYFIIHPPALKRPFSTDMRTLFGPRSATILTPLRGLAASPAVNVLEEALG